MFTMNHELPRYLGPFSVSTSKMVAKQFSNEQGLLFSIASSYLNPFKFCVGIDMVTFTSFKNEAEILLNNQPIPIKKTETFGDAMERLVNHLLWSLKNRKTRILDKDAFFNKIGIEWNVEWIPKIADHFLLFQETKCKGFTVIDRLYIELDLNITAPLLATRAWSTKCGDKSYLEYLVEDLKVAQLYDHYRVLTSRFKVVHRSPLLKRHWLRFEQNTKIVEEFGDDGTCFENTKYRADDNPIPVAAANLTVAEARVIVQNTAFFGDDPIVVQEFEGDCNDFVDALIVDQYGCIFVDDTLRIGQEVQGNNGLFGTISQMTADKICVKTENDGMYQFRWIERMNAAKEITIAIQHKEDLKDHVFVVTVDQRGETVDYSKMEKHSFSKIDDFSIPLREMLFAHSKLFSIDIYAKPKGTNYEWTRIKSIDYSVKENIKKNTADHDVNRLFVALKRTESEIKDASFALNSMSSVTWTKMRNQPILFDITAYRSKLVIERLIVEVFKLNTKCIRWLMDQKKKDKSLLQWLVEDRKVYRLFPHYRVMMSRFKVSYSAPIINRLWLKFERCTKMDSALRFKSSDDSIFGQSEYEINGVVYPLDSTPCVEQVSQQSIRNEMLFGDIAITIDSAEVDGATSSSTSNSDCDAMEFNDAVTVDQYGYVFVDDILRIGQKVRNNEGLFGTICRTTTDKICVKTENDGLYDFRWIQGVKAPAEISVAFRHESQLERYNFAVAVNQRDERVDFSTMKQYSFSKSSDFSIPLREMLLGDSDVFLIDIYAKPKEANNDWTRIKAIEYSTGRDMDNANDAAIDAGSETNVQVALDRLFENLKQSQSEILNRNLFLRRFRSHLKPFKMMSHVSGHPKLFDLTVYRRRLVIERLVVEVFKLNQECVRWILDQKKGDNTLLQWLVEERKLYRLFPHYRVMMSGFKMYHKSILLNQTWLKFQRHTKMDNFFGFDTADDSIFAETEYTVNDVVYPLTAVPVVEDVPSQCIRSTPLFGDIPVTVECNGTELNVQEQRESKAVIISSKFANMRSSIQDVIEQQGENQIKLEVDSHRGHWGDRHIKSVLEEGTSACYDSDGKGPPKEDWFIFDQQSKERFIPTRIVIRNGIERYALKKISIAGKNGSDGIEIKHWLTIDDIRRTKDELQTFSVDPAVAFFAWSQNYNVFRINVLENHGGSYNFFYEFRIYGVCYNDVFRNFIDTLKIDGNEDIVSVFCVGQPVAIHQNGESISGTICRIKEEKFCTKVKTDNVVSQLQWFDKCQLDIPGGHQISEYTFAAIAGDRDREIDLSNLKEFTFKNTNEFVIPMDSLVAGTRTADTIFIYARPKRKDIPYHHYNLIKTLEYRGDHLNFSRYVVDEKKPFRIDKMVAVKPYSGALQDGGKFEVRTSSKIIISELSGINASECGLRINWNQPKGMILKFGEYVGINGRGDTENSFEVQGVGGGIISLVAGDDVVNEGTLCCTASDDRLFSGGSFSAVTDCGFENAGTIDCGKDGLVRIGCCGFVNCGQINPPPNVMMRLSGSLQARFKNEIAFGVEELMKLKVVSHRGHYERYHIENLLKEGKDTHYTGYQQGPPKEDWFIFRVQSMQRFIPKSIVILNSNGDAAVEKMSISGSADYNIGAFTEWIEFDDIPKRDGNYSLSKLPVDEESAYSAWLQEFTCFKINILENYGSSSENYIFEFRIYGIYCD